MCFKVKCVNSSLRFPSHGITSKLHGSTIVDMLDCVSFLGINISTYMLALYLILYNIESILYAYIIYFIKINKRTMYVVHTLIYLREICAIKKKKIL